MGFPLRSNIFKYGTEEQKYFSRFPVQVAVLFDPKDQDFVNSFRNNFLTLDRRTGGDLAFFAVLDPPQEWLTDAENRAWWQDYKNRMGQIGFSLDDRVLIKEIARLFGVSWRQLPQIVVGTNLWTGEYVKSPTSAFHIERQLETLTNLVREWGQPNIAHIDEILSDSFGVETQYHPPDDELRYRFSRVYGILDTVESPNRIEQYSRLLEGELRQVDDALRRIRRREDNRQQRGNEQILDDPSTNSATENIIEDAAGRLIAPATVARKIVDRFGQDRNFSIADMLEEESLIMAETAITIGDFLENLENGSLRGITPLRLGTKGRSDARWHPSDLDFTPGAQGAWKAFELEINFSIIQAARASIFIRMPEFFTIYDEATRKLPSKPYKIQTGVRNDGQPIYKDINQPDVEMKQTGQHRFLPIGDALYVAQALSGTQDYEKVISMCLGRPLPPDLFNAWQSIQRIRNKGSHIRPLGYPDYRDILENALSPNVLEPLITIKRKLSTRPPN